MKLRLLYGLTWGKKYFLVLMGFILIVTLIILKVKNGSVNLEFYKGFLYAYVGVIELTRVFDVIKYRKSFRELVVNVVLTVLMFYLAVNDILPYIRSIIDFN